MPLRRAAILSLIAGFAATTAVGQTSGPPSNQGAAMTNAQQGDGGTKERAPAASTTEFKDAAVQLQVDMAVRYTGKTDHDFGSLLSAYHKGAIAAANIELKHGTDPEMRRLAEKIISANEKEIAQIQAWQKKHQ
jgi:uncharacterized protein (DUF305 family)